MNHRHLMALTGVIALTAVACSEPAPPPPPAPTAVTAETLATLYKNCWDQFNNKAWDQFQNCMAENLVSEAVDSTQPPTTSRAAAMENIKKEAESFPDRRGEVKLVLVNGSRIAGVALFTGTNTGPLPPGPDGKPVPATNKKVGLLMGHLLEIDATGTHATRESVYMEEGTFGAQLGLSPQPARPAMTPTGEAPVIALAKNDATETANVATVRAMMDAGNKHDFTAMESFMADDYKLIEIGQPKDLDKKGALASTKEFLAAFKDLQATANDVWAASDYVVIVGKIDGTNTGPMPAMGITKATNKKVTGRFLEICRIENGKVKEDWLFYNGVSFATQLALK